MGQRFFEGCEVLHALRSGHVHLAQLVPDYSLAGAMPYQHARAVVAALHPLGARPTRAPDLPHRRDPAASANVARAWLLHSATAAWMAWMPV